MSEYDDYVVLRKVVSKEWNKLSDSEKSQFNRSFYGYVMLSSYDLIRNIERRKISSGKKCPFCNHKKLYQRLVPITTGGGNTHFLHGNISINTELRLTYICEKCKSQFDPRNYSSLEIKSLYNTFKRLSLFDELDGKKLNKQDRELINDKSWIANQFLRDINVCAKCKKKVELIDMYYDKHNGTKLGNVMHKKCRDLKIKEARKK